MICLRLLKVKFPVNSEQRKSALRSYWSGEWPNEPWLQQKQSRIYQRGRIYFIRPIKSLLCLCSADGILTSKLSTAPSFTTLLFILTIRKTSKTKMRFFSRQIHTLNYELTTVFSWDPNLITHSSYYLCESFHLKRQVFAESVYRRTTKWRDRTKLRIGNGFGR